MKVIYKMIACLSIVLLYSSCRKNFLDRPSQGNINEQAAYGSINAATALLVGFYSEMETEDLSKSVSGESYYYLSMFADEAVPAYGSQSYGFTVRTGALTWWGYKEIRRLNDFIEKIPAASALTEVQRTQLLAEARFIRAFDYFQMVKRYGGVPLITVPQTNTGDVEQLRVPRDKEQVIYDFIGSEIDAIVAVLPASYTTADGSNRATKWAALALKSRAMLYAASIAKYGAVQLNGIVGIPANLADGYWQKAYDAANTIITTGGFSLYRANPDKALNFQQLFLNGDSPSNKETIFVKSYVFPGLGTSFDFFNQPNPFWFNYSSSTNPTVGMVEEFEYTDGSPGTLKVKDASGNPIVYNKPEDLFANKDPRLFGSIMTPNTPWAYNGVTRPVEIRRGIIDGGVEITRNTINATELYGTAPNQINIVGSSGPLTTSGDATKTGFYIKKFLTMNAGASAGDSPQSKRTVTPWMIFRYAEVLLNFAEAAVELGKPGDAKGPMDDIRTRGGIITRSSYTLEQVRHERKVELAFENHRFWDLRRWRTATTVISSLQSYELMPWLMWQNNTPPSQMKYTFTIVPSPKNTLTFENRTYYEPMKGEDIAGNPLLIQNPGY
jgi:hypothetical protein